MKNQLALSLKTKYQITETIIILISTMALPLLVHLLPNIGGNVAGAVLLPVFIAPMMAIFFFKKHVALLAGLFAPLFNYLLTGNPVPQVVILLSFEITAFVLILNQIKGIKFVQYLAAPIAYFSSVVIAIFTFASLGVFANPIALTINTLITATPGMIILTLTNLAVLRYKK